jgi:hypothetical protein
MVLFILLNIVSFFRLVFILLIIYYLFKFFMRFMAPRLVDRAANKLFQDMKNREAEQTRRTTRSGDVIIDTNRKKQKHYSRNVGDYIEFEEIKDKKK